jgi:hypothetical protein
MALSETKVTAIFAAFQARFDSALWLFFVRSRFCASVHFSLDSWVSWRLKRRRPEFIIIKIS